VKNFILTLQFLTRIPIRMELKSEEADFAKGVAYFPTVGIIVGAFNLAVYYIAERLLGGLFPAVCCIAANVAITGALHIDGLADTCDGIFSSRTRDRMLEIMRDSRIGTNGTIAVVLDLLTRLSIIASMEKSMLYAGLLLSPVAAKTLMAVLMKTSVYARSGPGLGKLYLEKLSVGRTAAAVITGIAAIAAIAGFAGLIAFGICIIACVIYRQYIYSKIQGMTGDTLGAANEVLEISFLLSLAVLGGVL